MTGTRRGVVVRTRAAFAVVTVSLAACLGSCVAVPASGPVTVAETATPEVPTTAATPDAPAGPVRDVPVRPGTVPTAAAAAMPAVLRIADIDVSMPVVGVGVEQSGQMELPVDPAVAGWYRHGPGIDADSGNVVIAAHVDAVGYPIGPMAGLRDLGAGVVVEIEASDGSRQEYEIASVVTYDKKALPAAEIFSRDGEPGLVLITCGGPFDSSTGSYRDNVVAVAYPR